MLTLDEVLRLIGELTVEKASLQIRVDELTRENELLREQLELAKEPEKE